MHTNLNIIGAEFMNNQFNHKCKVLLASSDLGFCQIKDLVSGKKYLCSESYILDNIKQQAHELEDNSNVKYERKDFMKNDLEIATLLQKMEEYSEDMELDCEDMGELRQTFKDAIDVITQLEEYHNEHYTNECEEETLELE